MKSSMIFVFLGLLKTCVLETDEDDSRLLHTLTKRQAPDEYRHGAPLPYQQADSSNGVRAPTGSDLIEDWVASSSYGSQAGESSRSSYQTGGATHSADYSPNGGRPYYRYQPPVSTGRRPAGSSGTYGSNPGPLSGTRTRNNQERTYTYPFDERAADDNDDDRSDEDDDDDDDDNGFGGRDFGDGGRSFLGDEEPSVQAFPSEAPTVTTINPDQLSREEYQELLRQRRQERQRLLLERQQQQQQQQQQSSASSASASSPSSSSSSSSSAQRQLRPIYTGSQPLGNYGPTYHSAGVLRTPYPSGQTQYGTGQTSGQTQYGTGQQPQYGTGQQPQYGTGQPSGQTQYGTGQYGGNGAGSYVNTGGVYGGGQQIPFYNYGYGQTGYEDDGSYDSECPNTGIRIQINGLPCEQAIDHYGNYLCYRHEYTSRECCVRCRGLKNTARVGCEYGDHSGRCQQLQPYDCYDLRNRQSCCQTCERMQKSGARSGCEYGDMTPNCERVRSNPGLCYIPENRYLCCETCSNIRVTEDPECPWGDQNPDLCQPFDRNGNIRINCYAPPIKRICCQACRRLEEWIPFDQPGCEYGDKPVTFNTGSHRNLNCTTFMRYFGHEQCTLNQAVATNCCYTCHRYTQG